MQYSLAKHSYPLGCHLSLLRMLLKSVLEKSGAGLKLSGAGNYRYMRKSVTPAGASPVLKYVLPSFS